MEEGVPGEQVWRGPYDRERKDSSEQIWTGTYGGRVEGTHGIMASGHIETSLWTDRQTDKHTFSQTTYAYGNYLCRTLQKNKTQNLRLKNQIRKNKVPLWKMKNMTFDIMIPKSNPDVVQGILNDNWPLPSASINN